MNGPVKHPALASPAGFPASAPRARALAADAWAGRARRLAHPAGSVRTLGQGLAELGGARPPRRLPRTSLNRPTGPRRRLDAASHRKERQGLGLSRYSAPRRCR